MSLGQSEGSLFQCGRGVGEGNGICWALSVCHYQVVSIRPHSSLIDWGGGV